MAVGSSVLWLVPYLLYLYFFQIIYLEVIDEVVDFQVVNISRVAIITLTLDTNLITTKQGTTVSPIAPVTFLYGMFLLKEIFYWFEAFGRQGTVLTSSV